MMFKEQVAEDNKVFLNLEEFSDIHMGNGREMAVLIDGNEMIEREKRHQNRQGVYTDGVYIKELLIYVRAEDFGKLPAIGRVLTMDGKTYTISDAIDEDGIYSLSLEANRTGR